MPEDTNPNPQSTAPANAAAELDVNAVNLGTIDAVHIALVKAQWAALGISGRWSQEMQVAAIVRLVACIFGTPRSDARIVRLFALLNEHGLGGNASQFQQWLATDDVKLLPPKDKKAKATADSLLA